VPASSRTPVPSSGAPSKSPTGATPNTQRTWVALVDGANDETQRIRLDARRRHINVTIIVDVVDVIEYLWRAACLYGEGHPAAPAWVHRQATRILKGRAT
jgi:hypothetical protein